MKREALALVAAFFLAACCGGQNLFTQGGRGGQAVRPSEDNRELLVKFKTAVTEGEAKRFAAREGLLLVRRVSGPSLYLFRVPAGASLEETTGRLSARGEVEYAERNYERR